jgi:glutaredoxin 2
VIRFDDGTTSIANCNDIKIIKKAENKSNQEDVKLSAQSDGANISVKESVKKNLRIDEWGVYNSEHDLKNKVKTKENTPEKFNKLVDMVASKVGSISEDLKNLENTIKNETNLSFDSITVCIAELETYIKALKSESSVVGPG